MAMITASSFRQCTCASRSMSISRSSAVCAQGSTSGAIPHGGTGGMHRPKPNKNLCGVFQLTESPVALTLDDVRDACEACNTARTAAERRQCFEVYGLDADKVDRYYDRVCEMERLIDQGDSVAQNMVASGGAMFLYFMAYCILRV